MLHLVRHGRPIIEPSEPPAAWELDPAGFDDVWALRESGRLPAHAVWFCSPETKAIQTAQLLTESDVGVLPGLHEHAHPGWFADFETAMASAFEHPDASAYDGWEPVHACRERLLAALRPVATVHGAEDVVLVGHGTAWLILVSALTGFGPDLERWRTMRFPDLIEVDTWET